VDVDEKIVMKFWLFNINRIIFFSAAAVNFLFSCRGVQTVLVTVITIGSRADVSVIALTPKQLCTYHQQAGRGTTAQDDVVDAKHATQPKPLVTHATWRLYARQTLHARQPKIISLLTRP
jgi:hypothetical protein